MTIIWLVCFLFFADGERTNWTLWGLTLIACIAIDLTGGLK